MNTDSEKGEKEKKELISSNKDVDVRSKEDPSLLPSMEKGNIHSHTLQYVESHKSR